MAPKVSPTETTSQPFVDRKVIHREDAVIDNTVTDKQGWEHYEAPVTEPKKDLPLQLSSEPMAHQEQSSRSIETIRERQVVVIPQANPFIPEKSTGNKSVNKKDIAAEHTVVASPRAIIAIGDQHKKNDVEHVVHVSKEREKGAAISVKPIKSADSENFHSRIRNQNTTARLQAPVNQAAASMINVSIGRIEIRATTTASSPVRDRRQTTPKLNLEEYLRVRSGGSK